MTIFKSEKNKKEFVAAFRKLTMSGVVSQDVAIEKLIRDNPHYFHQQTADEARKSFHAAMNDEIRSRARQTNRLADGIFANVIPTDKTR
jgi:hypothetical protein